MHPRKSRFVTTCQQLLVLSAVGAALVPAARLVNLDVVPGDHTTAAGRTPAAVGGTTPASVGGVLAAYTQAALTPSKVPAQTVDPTVRQISLTSDTPRATSPAAGAGRISPRGLTASAQIGRVTAPVTTAARMSTTHHAQTHVIVSTPQAVTGYGVVGLTWTHGDNLPQQDVKMSLRSEKHGVWSTWTPLEYDDDGPDPESDEGGHDRPGSIEGLVGHVQEVQARIKVTGVDVPPDLKLSVIDPGKAAKTTRATPAIDTARIDTDPTSTPDTLEPATPGRVGGVATSSIPKATAPAGGSAAGATQASLSASVSDETEAQAVMAAAAYTPKPQIYSRAQWGADEKLRDKPSLHYYEVHGGFVHHTVNSNNYTRAEVPGIIRSIYAYHVKSRGWSDIGYNFLIDKFGRIWEGRYGGVDRPVVGAHTENYNDWSFGVSAIGNYQIAQPSNALIQAEGALFAWKLSLHGVSAAATNVKIGPTTFASSIMGHRDTKATECPGKYLYAKIPEIRTIAASLQKGWSGRVLPGSLAGNAYPDLVVRRASDGAGFVIPTVRNKKRVHLGKPVYTGVSFKGATQLLNAGDWNSDGHDDVIAEYPGGILELYLGHGNGKLTAWGRISSSFGRIKDLAAVGDVTGDGYPDLSGQLKGGAVYIWPGNGHGGLEAGYVSHSAIKGSQQIGVGLWDNDGAPDSVFRKGGRLTLYPGNGPGGLTVGAQRALGSYPTGSWFVGMPPMVPNGRPSIVIRNTAGQAYAAVSSATGRMSSLVLLGSGYAGYDLAG